MILNMFYGVYYYNIGFSVATVYLGGYYQTLNDAKIRLIELIPNYVSGYKNSVKNNCRIGWVNVYELGDVKFNGLSCCQPHSSINLFDDTDVIKIEI